MRRMLQAGTLALAITIPLSVTAQVGIAPHIGTLGIGADLAIGLAGPLSVRGGANVNPYKLNLTESGIDYQITFPSPEFTLFLDLSTPVGFRVSGGLLISPDDIAGAADFTGSIVINDVTYSSGINTLDAAIVNKSTSPYVGIGWGTPGKSRVGFFLDLGVAFQGEPTVTYNVTGSLATNAALQSDLALEAQALQDGIDKDVEASDGVKTRLADGHDQLLLNLELVDLGAAAVGPPPPPIDLEFGIDDVQALGRDLKVTYLTESSLAQDFHLLRDWGDRTRESLRRDYL